ncbi:MAG: hypothetical protein RI573_15215 [Balneolaceae bacterium]|nr:hypothetical protein [Balneolaceae bacterium]
MIGVRRLPEPLPIEIVLVQDTPEESEETDPLAKIIEKAQAKQGNVEIAKPNVDDFEEITKKVQSEKDTAL